MAPDGIITIDLKGVVTSCNTSFLKLSGYSEDEIVNKHFTRLPTLRKSDMPRFTRIFASLLKGNVPKPVEISWIRKDGAVRVGEVRISIMKRGARICGFQAIARDVTERKRMEDRLKESEEQFKRFFENSPDYCYMISPEGHILDLNKAALKLLGYRKKEIVGQPLMTIYPPESIPKAKQAFSKMKKGKKVNNVELSIVSKSGNKRTVLLSADSARDKKGKVLHSISVQRDITERKKAAKALEESEAALKGILSAAPIGIGMMKNRVFSFLNDEMCRITGYSREKLVDKSARILYDSDEEFNRVGKEKYDDIREKGIGTIETQFKHKQGHLIDVWLSSSALDPSDLSQGVLFTAMDITEHKRADKVQSAIYKISEATQVAENLGELYKSIHDTAKELMAVEDNFYIALYDENSRVLSFPYFVDKYEKNPGPQKLGKGLTEYVLSTGKPLLASPDVFEKLVKKGKVESVGPPSVDWLGVPLKIKDKTVGVMVAQSYTEGKRFRQEDRDVFLFISDQVAMAITRKQAEEAIHESEEKYRHLVENTNDALFSTDARGVLTYISPPVESITGYSPSEVIGHSFTEFIHEEDLDRIKDQFQKILSGVIEASEYRIKTKSGEIHWIRTSSRPVVYENRTLGLQGMMTDITERKKDEERILASLREKEVMMREIHHRVKNNMQIISSLLRLQSRQIESETLTNIFNVAQDRIKSMALIHESLYRSDDLARIDFADYVNKLTTHLFSIHIPEKGKISLNLDLKKFYLDIGRAIPCGLIINELVSNSLIHAFPGGKSGEVCVKLDHKLDTHTIVVKDNGIGFPENVDFRETETLGIQLVNDLVKQLNGKIKLERKGGTEFVIIFKDIE